MRIIFTHHSADVHESDAQPVRVDAFISLIGYRPLGLTILPSPGALEGRLGEAGQTREEMAGGEVGQAIVTMLTMTETADNLAHPDTYGQTGSFHVCTEI